MRTMAAGEFKAKCLAVMDEVAATGEPVLITKRGKPVARVVAPEPVEPVTVDSIFGSLRHMFSANCDLSNLVDPIIPESEWDHLRPDDGEEFLMK
jgi:prevent-host-death family protein